MPTDEPTASPTAVPPTPDQPTATPDQPTATPAQPTATSTPQPVRPPEREEEPTPELPTPTALPPTATPEPWTTEVEIVKQADTTTVLPGDTFAYTLVARNIGSKTAYDVIISDDVPQQLEVINLTSTKGDITLNGQTVTAYPRTLEAGEATEYRITVRVRAATTSGPITNTGRITTTTTGDTPGNNTSTVMVEIRTPQRKIQIVQAPPSLASLPVTAESTQVPSLAALAAIPTVTWVGMFGGLLLMFGGVLSWGLRGWLRREPAKSGRGSAQMAPGSTMSITYRVPPNPSAGPPRLGAELPAATPPAPLPPLVRLDRDDALRDALRGDL